MKKCNKNKQKLNQLKKKTGTHDAIIGFNYIIVNQIITKNLIFTAGIRREGGFSVIGATN